MHQAGTFIDRFSRAVMIAAAVMACLCVCGTPGLAPQAILLTDSPGDGGSDDSGPAGGTGSTGGGSAGSDGANGDGTNDSGSSGDGTDGDQPPGGSGSGADDDSGAGSPGDGSLDPGSPGDDETGGSTDPVGDGTGGPTDPGGDGTGGSADPGEGGANQWNPWDQYFPWIGSGPPAGTETPHAGSAPPSPAAVVPAAELTIATVDPAPLPLIQVSSPSAAPVAPSSAPMTVPASLPFAGPWNPLMPVAGHAAPTPVEALINDLQLAAATSDAEKSAGPTVKLFVAPEIRTNASPVGTQRGDQLIITIALIGASMMAVVAFIGWLRNRTSW